MPARELTAAQKHALAQMSEYEPGLWLSIQGIRRSTVTVLERIDLVERVENIVTGTLFYRLTDAGRAALANPPAKEE